LGKALVITEKPSVARDIVAALGGFQEHDGYWESDERIVTFSVGHIVELLSPEDVDPVYKRWTLENLPILPEKFELKPKSGTAERIRTIKKLLARDDVDEVVNACDAGREGELIFREIVEFLGSKKPVRRLWLQSLTREAIRDGFSHLEPGQKYDRLGAAAACRSQSDWLIGMNATRALTRRLQGRKEKVAWSAGRVQTPTLALVVERELEILAHVPRPFWRVEARFAAADHEYLGTWFDPEFRAPEDDDQAREDRIWEETRAREIAEAVRGRAAQAGETRKPSRETAPPLFDLTSLQREANRRFGWSARRTLNAAQRCYEAHKVLTYPRTDSRCLPNDYRRMVDDVLQTFAAQGPWRSEAGYLREHGLENVRRTFDDAGVSDHFAIIPTGKLPDEELRGDDGRLFDFVTRRFLANFHPAAVWTRVERTTKVAGHSFRSRSRTLDEPGWRAVIGQTEQEDQALPPLSGGQTEVEGVAVRTLAVEVPAEETKPPARIGEARLLTLMENAGKDLDDEDLAAVIHDKGIGTPATRADIIENLIAKGYLVRVGKSLRPTVKGIRLVDTLRRVHADRLASAELTGDMEYELREIERGTRTAQQYMAEIVGYTREIVDIMRSFDYDDLYKNEPPLGTCPCEKRRPVWERTWFYRCEEDPNAAEGEDCEFRIWKDKAGRYMDRQTISTLLRKLETPVLDGFTTRDGRTYQGVLTLEGKELKLLAAGGSGERASDEVEYEVNEQPLGPCPMGCGSEVIETPTRFGCRAGLEALAQGKPARDAPKSCPFVLPRTVCKREITRDEALEYVTNKRTGLLTEFTSRFGRPFAATLFLKENGRHGFEFQPRGKAAEAGAAPGAGQPPPRRGGRGRRRGAAAPAEAEAGVASSGEAAAPVTGAPGRKPRRKKGGPPSPLAARVVRRRKGAARKPAVGKPGAD
jgi:DNA topoisomerase-3